MLNKDSSIKFMHMPIGSINKRDSCRKQFSPHPWA